MYNIEYDIRINEYGRPYVHLNEDYESKYQHNFFSLELSRYILFGILNKRRDNLDENTFNVLKTSVEFLDQISDEVAIIIYKQMIENAEKSLLFDNLYNIQVDNIEERNKLPDINIIFEDKIFKRFEGLKVLVSNEMKIYQLVDGISNENWCLI